MVVEADCVVRPCSYTVGRLHATEYHMANAQPTPRACQPLQDVTLTALCLHDVQPDRVDAASGGLASPTYMFH